MRNLFWTLLPVFARVRPSALWTFFAVMRTNPPYRKQHTFAANLWNDKKTNRIAGRCFLVHLLSLLIAAGLNACNTPKVSHDQNEDVNQTVTNITPPESEIQKPTEKALVTPNEWSIVSATEDPFGRHEKTSICPSGSYGEENGYFEVETDKCNYLTVTQPALIALDEGETLNLVLWHLPLGGTGVAEAYVAIQIHNRVIWEKAITLPSRALVYQESVLITEPTSTGDPVYFHVRNHGTNSWRLLSIERKQETLTAQRQS